MLSQRSLAHSLRSYTIEGSIAFKWKYNKMKIPSFLLHDRVNFCMKKINSINLFCDAIMQPSQERKDKERNSN